MPCSFGLLPHPRSAACAKPSRLLRVTVTVRCIPLVTVAYDTWVARPARTTTLPPSGDGSQLGQRVRPVLGNHCIVGKSPEGSRQVAPTFNVCGPVLPRITTGRFARVVVLAN